MRLYADVPVSQIIVSPMNTMQINKNIPFYLAAAGLFVLLKFCFTLAVNDDLIFLLKPTDTLVGLFTGSQSIYFSDNGYYHNNLNILIGKSCSGFNFWVLSFLVFTYLGLKYFGRLLHKSLTLPAALACAYLLTVFANASRIFASIVVRNQTINILPGQQYLIHEAVGIITNLSFLILAYYFAEKFLNRRENHAKLI